MFFNINKKIPFSVHRIEGEKEGSSRIIITVPNQTEGSFNFDADAFLSSFQLKEGVDPIGKRKLVLTFGQDVIVLSHGLSPKEIGVAKKAFLTQLQYNLSSMPMGADPNLNRNTSQYSHTERRFKKRYLGAAVFIALGAFLFWPIDDKELVEITDPAILELIRAQQESGNSTAMIKQENKSAQDRTDLNRRNTVIKNRTEIIQQAGGNRKVKTTGFLSLEGNQAIHGAAAAYSITLGDGNKANNIPYLVFSSPRDKATTKLILNTENMGYTPVVVPVGFEEDSSPNDDMLIRVIASYCSADPIVMWTKTTITKQDLADSFMDGGKVCDWESALFNFNSAWGVASTDGLTETPFIVAPNGAIHQHKPSEGVTAEDLVEWLGANPSK